MSIITSFRNRINSRSRCKSAEASIQITRQSINYDEMGKACDVSPRERPQPIDQKYLDTMLFQSVKCEQFSVHETAQAFVDNLYEEAQIGRLHYRKHRAVGISSPTGLYHGSLREETTRSYIISLSTYLPRSLLFIDKGRIYFNLRPSDDLLKSRAGSLLNPYDIIELMDQSETTGYITLNKQAQGVTRRLADHIQSWSRNGSLHLIPSLQTQAIFPFKLNSQIVEDFHDILSEYVPIDRITMRIVDENGLIVVLKLGLISTP